MFRKKTEENLLPEGDVRRMIEAIDNIASGDFNEIDATDFNNPLYADKLNSMLKAVKQVNNLLCDLMKLWRFLAIIL